TVCAGTGRLSCEPGQDEKDSPPRSRSRGRAGTPCRGLVYAAGGNVVEAAHGEVLLGDGNKLGNGGGSAGHGDEGEDGNGN
ncbi:hypothetical protein BGX26_007512, partial [Mortierella sp. AD094]